MAPKVRSSLKKTNGIRKHGKVSVSKKPSNLQKQEEKQIQKLNRTLKALSASNKILMRATEESAYLQDVCRIIIEDCSHAMVWIGYAQEDEAKSVRPVAYAGFEEGYLETLGVTWDDTERGRGPTGTAIRTGSPIICQNMITDPQFAPWREEAIKRGYASSIALPLRAGQKVLGAINIYARQPDPFTKDEVDLLMELASDLAYGITLLRLQAAHAQAEATVRQRNITLENINKIFKQALTSKTEEELGQTCLCIAEEATGSKLGFIGEVSPDGLLSTIAISNPGWEACTIMDQTGHRKTPGGFKIHGIYGRVVFDSKSFYTNDPASHPDHVGLPPGHPPLESFLGVPLISEKRTIGMIAVANREGGYSQNELETMESLAPAIVEAFQRKRAEESLRKSNERFELLSETASRLLATDRPQEIINELCQKVMTYLDCHAFFNYLVDEGSQRLHLNAYAGIPKKAGKEIEWLDYGEAVSGCAARDACRIVAENIPNTPDPRTELVKSFGIKAYACHPLFSAGQVIGTLSFGTRSRMSFTEEELSLMKTVADRMATAMERVNLIGALRRSRDELEIRVQGRTAELANANEELKVEIAERKRTEEALQKRTHDLNERVKEINCLYSVSYCIDKQYLLLEEKLKNMVNLIPPGWQYPEIACVRLTLEGNEYKSDNFRETPWKQSSDIITHDKKMGTIEVFYLEKKPEIYEGPFLKEERTLINAIAIELGEMIAHMQAEKALKAERQRFNDVLEMLPAYLVLLAPDYHVPFANRFFRERFGESHGRRCFEYLFGRSEPCEACETYTVLKTMAPHEWEWTGPDGRNYSVFDFPFTDTDGSNLILEMGIDITERKRAEEQLRAAQNYNRSLIEASPDPLVTISKDGKIMDVNSSTEQVTGLSRDHLIGSDFSDYFTEPEKAREGYGKVFLEGLVRDYPLAIQHVSGRTTDVLYNATLYRNEAGEVQGVFAAARDITKRKRAQEALRQNEELLRNVLELLPVGIWITDKNGAITHGNPAGLQIWAGSRYVGIDQYGEYKGWWLDTGKRVEPEEWAAARAVIKGETSLNEEIEIECFDGSHKIILNSAIPLRNDRKEIMGAIIINLDITERKRTEKAVRQMQKMESLGTLAGGIAHDFNNILMPIVINTELALLDTPEDSSITNYLKVVQEAANRGKDLIKQIITFSRQKEQVKVPIEIGPVIKEALKFLRASIPKTIDIRENIEVAPSSVIADPTQIHQVLMNLCSNAAYAMREKGGVLELSLTPVEVDAEMVNRHLDLKPGPYLRLTVADTGQGMDKEVMEKIFDPFFTTKKPGEGTGMGLAVVHGIVKNHGGAITVYSEGGKGSTFNVFLPQIKSDLKTETAPLKPISTGKERILLVDDEEIQIRSVQPMLERLGYKVIGRTDVLEALEAFKEQPDAFDLVITDQTMPHLTGRDLAEELLRIRPDIPIILCTGFSEVIHEEEAKAMGIREFIMKPFSLNEMAGIIRKSLGKNR
jgi:PAS domain S-box-containing protein